MSVVTLCFLLHMNQACKGRISRGGYQTGKERYYRDVPGMIKVIMIVCRYVWTELNDRNTGF